MLSITFFTIDWSSLCRFKGDFTFLFTIRAGRFMHCPRTIITSLETHSVSPRFRYYTKRKFPKRNLKNNLLYVRHKRASLNYLKICITIIAQCFEGVGVTVCVRYNIFPSDLAKFTNIGTDSKRYAS
jgi:hypothetical protein